MADLPNVDLLVVASSHDPLTPATLLGSAPRLAGMASLCETEVLGHTSWGDPLAHHVITTFLADGDAGVAAARCAD